MESGKKTSRMAHGWQNEEVMKLPKEKDQSKEFYSRRGYFKASGI